MEDPTYHVQVKYAVEFLRQLLSQVDEAAGLVLVGDLSQFRPHGLLGVTREEMCEVFLQVAIYCGIPAGIDSVRVAREALAEVDAAGR